MSRSSEDLIPPHGGKLLDLYVQGAERDQYLQKVTDSPSWTLNLRQSCDLELILNGGFSPLAGYMCRHDYEAVVQDMRLADGTLFPLPMNLDVPEEVARQAQDAGHLALLDAEGLPLALLEVHDAYSPNLREEAQQVFGTLDCTHPAVDYLLNQSHPVYLDGRLIGLNPPVHHEFLDLRQTPAQMRQMIRERGWQRVVAFQTRNPMHRAHVELVRRAGEEHDAATVINPVVGATKPGDIDQYSRVRCYRRVLRRMPPETSALSLLPLAMRMGGPREAVWHAILRKNYGFTHFIVGRDHAGPGKDSKGQDFYGPYDAQELLAKHAQEVGIQIVPFRMMVYVRDEERYRAIDEITDDQATLNISGTQFRQMLQDGSDVPEWFSYPEVVEELRQTHPPRERQGLVLFMTGLSGAGKSTVANVVLAKLTELGGRRVDLLDGDRVRQHLSSELGFSKEHRDLNIQRIGYVASLIAKHGGVAICAPIAPYAATREQVRRLVGEAGGAFVEIHVAAPLEVCEQRDRKGLYAKARQGLIENFTGISDPYEEPEHPEIYLDTSKGSPADAAETILTYLRDNGYLA